MDGKRSPSVDARAAAAAVVLEYLISVGALATAALLDEKIGDAVDDTAAYSLLQGSLSHDIAPSSVETTVLQLMCARARQGKSRVAGSGGSAAACAVVAETAASRGVETITGSDAPGRCESTAGHAAPSSAATALADPR